VIDAYEQDYLDSKDDCHKRLFEGGSDYIRWIPETKAECDGLKCVDCRRSVNTVIVIIKTLYPILL
jgi:hypothetical protein